MNSSHSPRVPAAAEIFATIVVGAYTELLDRKELMAYAMSLLCQIEATAAELKSMDAASPLAIETGAALAVSRALFEELKAKLTTS